MALYKENELAQEITTATEFFQARLRQLRAGRVRVDMFEEIPVMAYGMSNSLKGVAAIDIKGPLEVSIQPWDPTIANDVYKAIQEANLGFNPVLDGNKIRINMPPLTEETRKQTVKELGQMLEDSKVTIRQIRHKYKELIEKLDGVSEDEQGRSQAEVQKKVDAAIENLVQVAEVKKTELMTL